MQALLIVINVLLVLNAVVLIVSVLMQEGSRQGLGTIGGGAETFFGKSKAKSYEGKLEMITKVGVGTFIVLATVMTAMNARTGISNQTSTTDLSQAPSISEVLDQTKAETDNFDLTLPEATASPEATAVPDETIAPEAATAEPTVAPEPEAATAAPEAVVEPTVAPTEAPVETPAETPAT